MKYLPLAFLLALTACKDASTQQAAPDLQQKTQDSIQQELKKAFEANSLLGLSVQLLKADETLLDEQFGLADIDRNIPITDSTIFRIASITKTFTAVAMMQLQSEGLADLDKDVSEYLGWELRNPEYPREIITLRMLMNHTSSIRDGKGYSAFTSDMLSNKVHIRELLSPQGKYFTKDLFAEHQPGTYFSYTNCTWGIIATVIERISGKSFDQYCRDHIFGPMEMDAEFDPHFISNLDRLAVLYRYDNDHWEPQSDHYLGIRPEARAKTGYEPGTNGLLYGPQGGLRCSANDLAKLARLFWNKGRFKETQILPETAVAEMLASEWTYDGTNGDTWEGFFHSYGLGIHHITNTAEKDIIFPDRRMSGHPGIAYGLLSDLYFDPESKVAVIFITNGSQKEYVYGEQTSFYQPEEDVFSILYPFLKSKENSETSK